MSTNASEKTQNKRTVQAVVTSDKMNKTFVAESKSRFKHPLYGKIVHRRRKYKVHDENNEAKTGDIVLITESRPLSKEKRWALSSILQRAENLDSKESV